ncbi:pilus assembly protein [Escherichia coli]|nr:pilus assembly protein [Escherichia coli]
MNVVAVIYNFCTRTVGLKRIGNDSNLLIVFYVQIMPDDFVMQLHRF